MDPKSDQLMVLRSRAESLLKHVVDRPDIAPQTIDEVVHELSVYHVELEIQLEDLQQTYHALEIAQQRYARLFDFAPVGYIVTDAQGIVINANLTACAMLGVPREQLEKTAFAEFVATNFQDIYHLYRRAVLQTQQALICEVQLRKADGALFYAQLNTDLPDHPAETFRTAITDISAVKETEDALRRTLTHEMETSQIRTRVLAVIAHEFRTPLAIILSSVETLDRYGDRLTNEKKQERYQTIRNLVWYLNDIVHDARSTGPDDGHMRMKPESFDVLDFIRQVAHDMEIVAKEGQDIRLEISAQHEKEMVTWDQNLLRRILMNLLSNALNYSHKPVRLRVECDEPIIRLRVEDQGIGISEEDQPHIFEAFYRGGGADSIRGTGIGLFVAQRAVQANGGSIRCESHVGEGTTFLVELPRQAPVQVA